MHPIERLRAVARAGPVDPVAAARHAAAALLACADRPAELVVSCRRLLDRQPAVGPLWWVCSVALAATEPRRALHDLIERADPPALARHLATAVEADALVVDACLASPGGVYVTAFDAGMADEAAATSRPLWVVAAPGVVVPQPVWDAATRRLEETGEPLVEFVPAGAVAALVTEMGVVAPGSARPTEGFPVAPELLARRV